MATDILDELLKLQPNERIEIANALWDSLSDAEHDATFVLSPELKAELDRRWAEHVADPDSAMTWEEVRKRLRNRR
jgi:putative addiction module component (TIGR02574 family)